MLLVTSGELNMSLCLLLVVCVLTDLVRGEDLHFKADDSYDWDKIYLSPRWPLTAAIGILLFDIYFDDVTLVCRRDYGSGLRSLHRAERN